MGVASMVLGIIALVLSMTGGTGWIGSICGVIAIILGAIAKKNPEQKKTAMAGLICGIIALCLGVITTIACVACIGATSSAINSAADVWNSL